MRQSAAILLVLALALVGCGSRPEVHAPVKTAEQPEPFAVKVLVQHLVDNKRVVSVGTVADETIWTDAAILEHAKTLPPTLRAHLGRATGQVTGEAMIGLLQRLASEQDAFLPATVKRGEGPRDCRIVGGDVEAVVDCIYVDYLVARYPKARFLVKGKWEPVLVAEGRAVHAVVMPVKLGPDARSM
jgi:hypothetical protein